MRAFQNYLKEVIQELKKVTWPTWDELKESTKVVIGFSIVMAMFVGAVDFVLTVGLTRLMEYLG